jgi:hypothetical protein
MYSHTDLKYIFFFSLQLSVSCPRRVRSHTEAASVQRGFPAVSFFDVFISVFGTNKHDGQPSVRLGSAGQRVARLGNDLGQGDDGTDWKQRDVANSLDRHEAGGLCPDQGKRGSTLHRKAIHIRCCCCHWYVFNCVRWTFPRP